MGPEANWESTKIGPGPVPIETPEGWLLINHGVWTSCSGFVYYAGAALLDLEQPWKVLHRSADYLLGPTELYERVGDVPNVVFPTAAVLDDSGEKIRLYYGCADTCIAMAEARVDELIAAVKAPKS
jgi:beta-1,4-mannooligosaccharide/beta-1,4-mannosyl-N-acetylglucosamine phosphorylase